MQIVYKNVADLIPYVNNARKNDNAVDAVASSIKNYGFKQPIVIDSQGEIVAGHTRLKAAKKIGLKEVPCIVADDLTPAQIKAYRIADNRVGELAEWDLELLHLELVDIEDFTGFEDLQIPDEAEKGNDEEFDADEELEQIQEPVTQRGWIYKLGNHRLMCGDSTSEEDIKRLMNGQYADCVFTDPPYGVSANGGRTDTVKKNNIKSIANDDLRGQNLSSFIISTLKNIPLKEGKSFYVCYDQKTQFEFTFALKSINWKQRSTIVWNKNNFGLSGFKGYRPKFELIAFGHIGNEYEWFGDNSQADVWDINRPTERHGNHPTPKPIELIIKALNNSTRENDLVVDVFGGSGSTLIACEEIKRKCFMMELDEKYCDVIVKRWENLTGLKVERIE